ncbi:uncharacterized protein LOC135962831 [Calliphora vicina]|uniref:uncharacterized protein LOC135962831 n=1 Tax=Calliphora vicina TaxID=7373 RepID=UPI00325AF9A6
MEHDLEAHLLNDLVWEDDDSDFRNFTRINLLKFEELLKMVHNRIKKSDTVMRVAIAPRVKLCITLRYIATGDSYKSLEFLSRVSRNTIGVFVPEVLEAIYESLQDKYLKMPNTENEWQQISDDFEKFWQFPHTLSALDGKHIRIKAPAHTGSHFFNFKGYFSIVLFAAVDAHTRFTYINVGCNGKSSDNTIYSDSYLYQSLKNGTLNIPQPIQLIAGEGNEIPYFFIGDDAFAQDRNLMKPYARCMKLSVPQEIFNYRICRARMVVECAFGRLSNRFRIFHRPIEVQPTTVDAIVKACCVLHNYLTKSRTLTIVAEPTEQTIVEAFSAIGNQSHKTYKYSCRTRDELSRYLTTYGNVDFQWQKINIQ